MSNETEKAKGLKDNEVGQSEVDGVVVPLDPRVAKIHANRVLKITADIDHLRNRPDCEVIKDELDQAIRLLLRAANRIEA